uniref:ATP synthase F0 subunit 8 n=1 Tax=Phlossa conjucta TaxID=2567273 RepID=UPI0023AA6016|nr:ATP synthase F0 subunit 8 [Phlossa conjucta]WCH63186.1 ATP synthase F0 subunit 8 [Phlossa conjucta]
MPQMMPINWMMSLLFFISIFIMFNIFNYYIINLKKNKMYKLSNKFSFKNLNWKW